VYLIVQTFNGHVTINETLVVLVSREVQAKTLANGTPPAVCAHKVPCSRSLLVLTACVVLQTNNHVILRLLKTSELHAELNSDAKALLKVRAQNAFQAVLFKQDRRRLIVTLALLLYVPKE
jgi:hypothetical protein